MTPITLSKLKLLLNPVKSKAPGVRQINYSAKFLLFINSVKFGSPDDFFQFYEYEFLERESDVRNYFFLQCRIGSRPIHLACKYKNIRIIKLLIELKCNINIAGEDGMYPIHFACKAGNVEIALLLINAGCNIKDEFVCDHNGYFPIHHALRSGNVKLVKLLVGLQCELRPTCNKSILFGEQQKPIHIASKFGCVEVLKYLIDQKHDIEAPCGFLRTRPIHFACEMEHVEIVKILTDLNCSVNSGNSDKTTPLNIAVKQGNQEIINILRRAIHRRKMLKLMKPDS